MLARCSIPSTTGTMQRLLQVARQAAQHSSSSSRAYTSLTRPAYAAQQHMFQPSRQVASSSPTALAATSADGPNLVGEAGQCTETLIASMKQKIAQALETEQVQVVDMNGDGRHVCIEVISPLFEGQNTVKRQRMVYKAIWEEMSETVHAVDQMITKSPSEVGQ